MEAGPCTAAELAERTATHERYVREWLEGQTVNGILDVEDESLAPGARKFRIPPAHAEVLTACESLNYMAPLVQLFVGAVSPLPAVLQAFRDGGGVPFDAFGADLREGQAALNYPGFMKQLASEWLPAMPDVDARLRSEPPARIADFGCGFGWSSIGMAQGYPSVRVDGFDLDGPSIARARENARANRVDDRVQFHVRDAADPIYAGQYDLVTAFECLHDMSNPVGALRTMRLLAGKRGTVFIVDENVGDAFSAQSSDNERMMYGWSILHCLPAGMSGQPSAATGTVMRAGTLRQYAADAGFSSVQILPLENFFFRFYRLNA
jgi:2-polyprenyl-3-methyl-5-hydroxy-6-metoxy-1,4-benzoquinol methylase